MTITHRINTNTSLERDAWLEINLAALERNFKKLHELLKTNIMAVIKADAYGHGACILAPVLQSLNVHSFGVATIDEGIALRNSGIKVPIIILGAIPNWSYESCLKNELTTTVYSLGQLDQLEILSKKTNIKIPIHLKVDTGMNRLGINFKEAKRAIESILKLNFLKLEGIFTHLADAKDYEFSKLQKVRFDQITNNFKNLKITKHIANSYAGINYPEFRYDLVRLGIALYGEGYNFLEPLISLRGRISQIHEVQKGESISYERTWTAEKETLIATVPIGYADGLDRNLSNKIYAFYKGKKIKQVGNITMDQTMFDITEVQNPQINEVITLLGDEIDLTMWAEKLNTIPYELLCRFKMRLPRIYTRVS